MKNLIRRLLKEAEEEQYYKISAPEYVELMKLSGYHGNVTKLKKFEGKPLLITGTVVLSNTSTDSLGNVAKIEGNLDISHTNVKDLSGIEITGHIWDNGTPREKIRHNNEIKEKKRLAQERREKREWDIENTDDEGIRANAFYKWLVDTGEIEELNDEEIEELEKLKEKSIELNNSYKNCEENCDELYDELSEVDEEIEKMESQMNDVYVVNPLKYRNYGLYVFETLGIDGLRGKEYSIGDSTEMDSALEQYVENYVNDVGVENFNEWMLSDSIDDDYLETYIREWYEDDIYQNPEIYFNENDFELTDKQELRISEIESEIEDYTSQQSNLESEVEDPEEYSRLWDDFQNLIDKLEEEKESIVPSDEPTDDMVEEKVQEKIDEATSDPIRFIKNYDLDLKSFIDMDKLAENVINVEGYSLLSHYDGEVDEVFFDNDTYYIIRID